jgi:hypothetical protein
VINLLVFVFGISWSRFLGQKLSIVTEVSHDFPQSPTRYSLGNKICSTNIEIFSYHFVLFILISLTSGSSRDRVPMRWIFSNLSNPSCRTMALGSTQPLTEISTRNLKKETWGVKCGRRIGLTNLPPSVSRLSK